MSDTLKKSLATVGLTAGLVLGGLGIAQVASAQTDTGTDADQSESTDAESTNTESTNTESSETDGRRDGDCEGKGNRRGGIDREAVAEALGMTTDELRAEFEAGNSLADVAAANGVDVQDLIDMMVADATEHINEKVAEGDLTQEEADTKLAELSDRIEERVNTVPSEDGRRSRGGEGHRDRGGDANTNADSDVDADQEVEGEGS